MRLVLVLAATCVCSLSATGPVAAVDWVRVDGKAEFVEVYVNRHSIQRDDRNARL